LPIPKNTAIVLSKFKTIISKMTTGNNNLSINKASNITLGIAIALLMGAISLTVYTQNVIRSFDVRVSLLEAGQDYHINGNPNIHGKAIDGLRETIHEVEKDLNSLKFQHKKSTQE